MPETLSYETPPAKARSYVREAMVFSAGAVLGALIWALSPTVTGEVEAWEAQGYYYFAGLFISGLIAACVAPSRFWVAPIGVFCGQFGYVTYGVFSGAVPNGPLWPLGACMGLGMCVLALLGAVIPAGVAQLFSWIRRRSSFARAWTITATALAIPTILLITFFAWFEALPEWLLSARNSPEGVIVEVYREGDDQPTFTTLLEGRTTARDINRVRRVDLPANVGSTVFRDYFKPGRWVLMLEETKLEIKERALIVDDSEEILPDGRSSTR